MKLKLEDAQVLYEETVSAVLDGRCDRKTLDLVRRLAPAFGRVPKDVTPAEMRCSYGDGPHRWWAFDMDKGLLWRCRYCNASTRTQPDGWTGVDA